MVALACIKTNYPHFIGFAADNSNCVIVPRNWEGKRFCDAVKFHVGHTHFQVKYSMLST